MNLKCMVCVGLMVMAKVKVLKGEEAEVNEPNDALTLAPVWQEKIVGNQMVMACVALPVCETHISVQELSPADQAIRNGQLLLGTMAE